MKDKAFYTPLIDVGHIQFWKVSQLMQACDAFPENKAFGISAKDLLTPCTCWFHVPLSAAWRSFQSQRPNVFLPSLVAIFSSEFQKAKKFVLTSFCEGRRRSHSLILLSDRGTNDNLLTRIKQPQSTE